ncbi:Metalloenzyme, LuxS/M16 peptidase-like protein [Lipomyces oligophaga]|uniref:Metalloenzyme, LuxS/M16 peptidase-like protein n=1 Tax=Lipomyces oligophaga TaxID=45792 RepID=UPI0034CEC447
MLLVAARPAARNRALLAAAAPALRRSYAAATGPSDTGFSTATATGVAIAAKDQPGAIGTLSFVIKAGSRYSTTPGIAHALERFAFQNTMSRSALRVTRESEYLGATFAPALSRDTIVLTADFLKEDLPYFFEVLSDVFARPHLARHELAEIVAPLLKLDSTAVTKDIVASVSEALHAAAFRRGLGLPLYAQPADSISATNVSAYKEAVYTKSNLAIVSAGIPLDSLVPLTQDFLEGAPAGTATAVEPAPFYAGESRVPSTIGNAIAIGYGGASAPEYAVLASILGGTSSLKWSTGTSLLAGTKAISTYTPYAGSGLFSIIASAGSVADTTTAASTAISALKSVASDLSAEDLKKGVAGAKFAALSSLDGKVGLSTAGLSLLTTGAVPTAAATISLYDAVTAEKVKAAAAAVLAKPAYAVAGKVSELPYIEELL